MINKRGFLDISFSLIFAVVVGAIILFGAIYFVNKAANTATTFSSATTGAEILNLLTPLETGPESAKSISIAMPVNSRLNHNCNSLGTFGKETIWIEEYIGNKWTEESIKIDSYDKYLFTPKAIEAREFKVFSKSFEFPFKVANLIYFTDADKEYCFKDFPGDKELELKNLNMENFEFDSCSEESVKICFNSGEECDVEVNYNLRTVKKDGKSVYFEGDSLMYAAIFSDENIYECELARLMKRAGELSDLYEKKSFSLIRVGCDSSVESEFPAFKSSLSSFKDSSDLYLVRNRADSINSINKYSECTLW